MTSDMTLTGSVSAVGGSSVEIRMVARCGDGDVGEWLEAYFTFVALDASTNRPVSVPQLAPSTPSEKKLEDKGLSRMKAKKDRRREDKERRARNEMIGSVEENNVAASLLAEGHKLKRFPTLGKTNTHIFMEETSLHNALICQPQQRNMHGRIFGGFLMRRAFELAFSTAYAFIGKKPTFDEVDDISFLVPVSVGDLCLFDSRVLYTLPDGFEGGDGRGLVFVEVIVLVASPETAESKMSNRLYFTFSTEAADGETQIKQILPEDMSEAKRMAGRMAADSRQVKEDGEA